MSLCLKSPVGHNNFKNFLTIVEKINESSACGFTYLHFFLVSRNFGVFNRFSTNSRLKSNRVLMATQSKFLDEFNLKIHNISKVKHDFLLVVSCEIFQCIVKSYRIEEFSDRSLDNWSLKRETDSELGFFFARKCEVQNRMVIMVFGI